MNMSPISGILYYPSSAPSFTPAHACLEYCSHTCIISFRTLGTSEKKNRAKMPATAPNDPIVTPLHEISASVLCILLFPEAESSNSGKERNAEKIGDRMGMHTISWPPWD